MINTVWQRKHIRRKNDGQSDKSQKKTGHAQVNCRRSGSVECKEMKEAKGLLVYNSRKSGKATRQGHPATSQC